MKRSALMPYLKTLSTGSDWTGVLNELVNSPALSDPERDTVNQLRSQKIKDSDIMRGMLAEAEGDVKPGLEAQQMQDPNLAGAIGAAKATGYTAALAAPPIVAGSLAAPAGPFAQAAAVAATLQAQRGIERWAGGENLVQPTDAYQVPIDLVTGTIGNKLGGLGSQGPRTVLPTLAQAGRAGTGFITNTAQGAASDLAQGRSPMPTASWETAGNTAMNMLGGLVSGQYGGKTSTMDSPMNQTEQALMQSLPPGTDPADVRTAVNYVDAVANSDMGGDILRNPTQAAFLIEQFQNQTIKPVIEKYLEILGVPVDSANAPLQTLNYQGQQAAQQKLTNLSQPSANALLDLSPSDAAVSDAVGAAQTRAGGLRGEAERLQGVNRELDTNLRMSKQEARAGQINDKLNSLLGQLEQAKAQAAQAEQNLRAAPAEAMAGERARRDLWNQRVTQIEQAVRAEQDAIRSTRDTALVDQQLGEFDRARQIEQDYQASKPTADQYAQVGRDVQEVVGQDTRLLQTGAGIGYSVAEQNILNRWGDRPIQLPAGAMPRGGISEFLAPNVSDKLRAKIAQLEAEQFQTTGTAGGNEMAVKTPLNVADLLNIYQSVNQKMPGGGTPEARFRFGQLKDSLNRAVQTAGDPELVNAWNEMNQDYATIQAERKNISQVAPTTNPYMAAQVGKQTAQARPEDPLSQLMQGERFNVPRTQAAELAEQAQLAKEQKLNAQQGAAVTSGIERRGIARAAQEGMEQASMTGRDQKRVLADEQAIAAKGQAAGLVAMRDMNKATESVQAIAEKAGQVKSKAEAQALLNQTENAVAATKEANAAEIKAMNDAAKDIDRALLAGDRYSESSPAAKALTGADVVKAKGVIDSMVKDGSITDQQGKDLLKTTARMLVDKTAVTEIPVPGSSRKVKLVQADRLPTVLRNIDEATYKALSGVEPVKQSTLRLIERLGDVTKATGNMDAYLNWFKSHTSEIDANGASSWDKLAKLYNENRQPGTKDWDTLNREIMTKALVSGDDGQPNMGAAVDRWDSMPEMAKKQMFGEAYPALDKTIRHLFPKLAVVNKVVKSSLGRVSWISAARSLISAASWAWRFGGPVALGGGAVAYVTGMPMATLGAAAVPVIAAMLYNAPELYLNAIATRGMKQTGTGATGKIGGAVMRVKEEVNRERK